MRPKTILIALASLGVLSPGLSAQSEGLGGLGQETDPSSVRLISGNSMVVAGRVNTLGLAFEIDPGWHIYFDGQNDTGFTPELEIDWPEGWELREIVEPVPHRHVSPGDLLDHVHEGIPLMLLRVFVPEGLEGTTVTLRGNCSWLVCQEACLLDTEELELSLRVVGGDEEIVFSPDLQLFVNALQSHPHSGNPEVPSWVEASWSGDTVSLRALGLAEELWEDGTTLEYYPSAGSASIKNLLESGSTQGKALSLTVGSGENEGTPAFRGIVVVISPDGARLSTWITLNRPEP